MKDGIYHLYELFEGNRIFFIPEYQRNYAWENRQLEDFYDDILYMDKDIEYFMGTVLLRKKEENRRDSLGFQEFELYEVIDGQQRLTTISIFIKAAIESLEHEKGEKMVDYVKDLEQMFIVKREILKLELSGEDAEFFRSYIIDGQEYPDETITPSQKRLKHAKSFFTQKFLSLSADEIKSLLSKLGGTRVLVYAVKEKGDSMLMFETINDRGKPLNNLEKTKSFLMYLVYISSERVKHTENELLNLNEEERKKIAEKTQKINKLLALIDEKFGKIYRYMEQINEKIGNISEDDIQRYHWALWFDGNYKSSFGYINKLKEYFRDLMLNKRDDLSNDVTDYIISLEQVFYAFKEVFVDKIDRFDNLKVVLLGRVANFYPLIISTWIKTKAKGDMSDFEKTLGAIEKFIFRVFLVGNKRSDTGVSFFYELGHDIFKGNADISKALNKIEDKGREYVSNKDILDELNNENFYRRHSSQDIRYIFYRYELRLREIEGESLSMKLDEILGEKYTIEHILAQDLSVEDRPTDLKEDEKFEEYVHRLGNLVLCSKSWNSSMGNNPFEDKKKCRDEKYSCYQKSIFKCQQKLAKYESFSKTEIDNRQKEMIEWIERKWNLQEHHPTRDEWL